jgi:hypothetical protein
LSITIATPLRECDDNGGIILLTLSLRFEVADDIMLHLRRRTYQIGVGLLINWILLQEELKLTRLASLLLFHVSLREGD